MRIAGSILSAAIMLFLTIMATSSNTPAYGQQRVACALYDKAIEILKTKHGESQVGVGVHSSGQWRIELWVGQEGSWSIIIIDAQGNACMASNGEGWEINTPDPLNTVPEADQFESD